MRALPIIIIGLITTLDVEAQVSNYGFMAGCPEGCRDIDKITSCGTVDATTSCIMAINGDITMTCNDGNTYTLGVQGCGANSGTPSGGTSSPSVTADIGSFMGYIDSHTTLAQARVFHLLKESPKVLSICLCVIGGLLGLIGLASGLVIRTLPGLLFGFCFFLMAAMFFIPGSDSNQWYYLTSGIAGGVLVMMLTAVKQNLIPGCIGGLFGLVGTTMTFYLLELKQGTVTSDGIPFFSVTGAMLLCWSLVYCSPFFLSAFCLAVEASICIGFGALHLWRGSASPFGPSTHWDRSGLIILGVAFGVSFVLQLAFALRRRNNMRKRAIREDLRRQGIDPQEYLSGEREGRPNSPTATASPIPTYGATNRSDAQPLLD